jgi:hypothetical protein
MGDPELNVVLVLLLVTCLAVITVCLVLASGHRR